MCTTTITDISLLGIYTNESFKSNEQNNNDKAKKKKKKQVRNTSTDFMGQSGSCECKIEALEIVMKIFHQTRRQTIPELKNKLNSATKLSTRAFVNDLARSLMYKSRSGSPVFKQWGLHKFVINLSFCPNSIGVVPCNNLSCSY